MVHRIVTRSARTSNGSVAHVALVQRDAQPTERVSDSNIIRNKMSCLEKLSTSLRPETATQQRLSKVSSHPQILFFEANTDSYMSRCLPCMVAPQLRVACLIGAGIHQQVILSSDGLTARAIVRDPHSPARYIIIGILDETLK